VTTVFLTGFPGFLGSALVERLLARDSSLTVACLVQPAYREGAERRARELTRTATADPEAGAGDPPADADGGTDRVGLYEGDITESDLGLDADVAARLQAETREVFHLAAVYDLGVAEAVGRAVNVRGTEHVLDFAEACPDLDRVQYVSTCYVSGRYDGVFTESMLREGQSFNNYYEATKYLAEVEVQERMADGLPATIYRPAIAVGDSQTGETQKYDGPYYVLQLLRRQPKVALLPMPPGRERYEMNVVPRDFVVDAIAHLSALDRAEGEVYQLCDPNPPTVGEVVRRFADAVDRRVVPVPTTLRLSKGVLAGLPRVADLVGVEPETLNYFTHPTRYTGSNALRDLAGTDVSCPPFGAYVDTLVAFVRENPSIDPDAMT
jgi:thioester reductase-like protein